ncbi:hypothetical protein [Sulfobacillus harzensis]|uniref:Uncharacterized protein n=1 Tax=Sulfobacillus harzensis TaxID=2729629 RepID=A0A7Y0L6U4_9FIRM|nr:hypothetical protein [Sulfobacillus harzensis]NMP24383.1 hypothetical protein [Sulfobacillus harzensis]
MMHDLKLVAQIRLRQWKAHVVYWLEVLGVDTKSITMMTRVYAFYLFLIGIGWVLVSWSGLIHMAHEVGSRIPPGLAVAVPTVLYMTAMIWWSAALARLPILMPHGDLEWMAVSPLSRRAILFASFVSKQVKVVVMALIVATVGFSLLGGRHLYGASLLTAAVVAAIQTAGWVLSSARAARSGPPPKLLWLLPGLMIPIRLLTATAAAPFARVLAPLGTSSVALALVEELAGWAALWVLAVSVSGRVNMISIASQSTLYADIRAAMPVFGMGGAKVVRRDVLVQHGMRSKKARGRLRSWPMPWWEVSRFAVSGLRLPRQALYLLETAALFRSALLAVFLTHSWTAWMFWIVVAYRFRFGGMQLWYRNDVGNSFVRQFWPESDIHRYLRATAIPLTIVAAISFVLWVVLPLSVPVTWLHGLFWFGLIVAWWVAEGPLLTSESSERRIGEHDAAVLACGVMLLVGSALAHPVLALLVPLILVGVAAIRSGRAIGVRRTELRGLRR